MLDVQGLTSHYGRIPALHGVDLIVARGELVALVGANGAGKTTLLRTLSGLQPANGGRIVFEGADITAVASDKRVRLGIAQVPEGRQVFTVLSVEDNLRLGAYTRSGIDVEADLADVYAVFPALAERRMSRAGDLSGGQQQMLAIGRALMAKPRLLLLDEPSMGLAPQMVDEIYDVILALRDRGTTILVVEQNAEAALSIADRGYVIENGRLVIADTGRGLLTNERVQRIYLGVDA
jgi:branched-chain amino acid transport system ATP-binding protein